MGLIKALIVVAIFLAIIGFLESNREKNMLIRSVYPVRHYVGLGGIAIFELCI